MAEEKMGFEGTMSKEKTVKMLRFLADEIEQARVLGLVKVSARVEGDMSLASAPSPVRPEVHP